MESGGHPLDAVFAWYQGTVVSFDAQVGVGTVRDPAGRTWPFHCTSITDGTRDIPSGVAVTFRVEPGPLGVEAVQVSIA